MRIGEVATRTGLTAKTLRFYEQAGLLPAPPRSPAGYRDYDESVLPRLRFVRAAQAAGLSLAEVRQVLALRERTGPPCAHVIAVLEAHLADLDQRIAEMSAMRDDVRRLRSRASTLDPAHCREEDVCHVLLTDRQQPHVIW